MKIFDELIDSIYDLDQEQTKKYIIITILINLILISTIYYFNNNSASKLTKNLKKINEQRLDVQKVIEEYKLILTQKDQIEEMLRKNPDFVIKKKFNEIIKSLNLSEINTNPIVNELEDGFSEVILKASIENITTKQFVSILDAIKKSKLAYTKEFEINKKEGSSKITAEITIGTIKTEGQESSEETEVKE
ncbi:MAG: hypothetical protein UR26_C0001G0057 [candidate division TM6 bacterium GW2011_GWF2_32_72]|nr:MAG: hypothetical protein UR26_C0001G0057 [candidate division TM6 bacterium GW2011_GWF2_32_72]